MKKLILIGLLLSTVAWAEAKYLRFQFNENVQIIISSAPCPVQDVKDKFPLMAGAVRIDGAKLKGCYTHEGDTIVIQWIGGDQTKIPASAFLQQ